MGTVNPVLINSHSGNDWFSEQQMHEFFSQAVELESKLSVVL